MVFIITASFGLNFNIGFAQTTQFNTSKETANKYELTFNPTDYNKVKSMTSTLKT